jgi:serine/threonine-protein kinase
MGTPNYMSPEQAQGRMIDGRSDQFSLAVVACRMLTGQLPFSGPTLTAVLSKILWEEPEYLEQIKDPDVRAVLRKALAKDPASRFSTCGEFTDALLRAYSARRQEAQGQPGAQAGAPPAGAGDDVAVAGSAPPAEMQIHLEDLHETAAAVAASGDASLAALSAPTQPLYARGTEGAETSPALPEAEPPSAPPEARLDVQSWDATPVLLSEEQPHADKKPSRTAVAIGVVITFLVLAGVLLAVLNLRKTVPVTETSPTQQPPDSKSAASPPAPSSQSPPTVQELYPALDAVKRNPSAQPAKTDKPALQKRQQSAQLPSSITRAPATAPKPPREAAPTPPMTGALTWTGRMLKNSLLIIEGQKASHGAVDGRLPGVPVTIEVDPPSVQIREAPNELNGWKRIMLYSGNQRYSSVTIRWTTAK